MSKIYIIGITVFTLAMVAFADFFLPSSPLRKDIQPSEESFNSSKKIEKSKVKHLGVTVSGFQRTYENLVEEYAVPSLRIRETHTSTKSGKYRTYFLIGSTVAIELETDSTKTQVQSITVFCEPAKGNTEKSVIERATVAYILVMEILTPELTPEECNSIIHKLSSNLKNYSVVEGNIRYKTRLYNGILMLSAEAR